MHTFYSKCRLLLICAPIFIICIISQELYGRSSWRKRLEQHPCVTTQWAHQSTSEPCTISDAHIEKYPLFGVFNRTHFDAHKFSDNMINYQINGVWHSVSSHTLSSLCEQLVTEVMAKKRHFTHFTILQKKNFSRRHLCGLLVVKFKDYPFVVKLFVENPESLTNYWCKGFEPIFFWNMGKGAGRHVCGLTRIQNRQTVLEQLAQTPFARADIHIPRKWFWEPQHNNYIKITGTHIGPSQETCTTELPGIYAIIADYIHIKDNSKLTRQEKNDLAIALCNHLDFIIDPHANNYIFTVDQVRNRLQITLIDTEYFPMMVGLKEKRKFSSHFDCYTYLVEKCISDTFYQSKPMRIHSATQENEFLLHYT